MNQELDQHQDMKIFLFGILIGESKVVLQGWLKFQKESIFTNKNIVGVSIAWEIPIDGEEKTTKIELLEGLSFIRNYVSRQEI